jgi:hypothetical protein
MAKKSRKSQLNIANKAEEEEELSNNKRWRRERTKKFA